MRRRKAGIFLKYCENLLKIKTRTKFEAYFGLILTPNNEKLNLRETKKTLGKAQSSF